MNKIFVAVLIISITSRAVSANVKVAQFSTESVAEQLNELSFKRVGSSYFGHGRRISKLQCAKVCMNEVNCKSVHVDGEACVFGVDDVSALEEGELITPDPSQVLKLKGRAFKKNYCVFLIDISCLQMLIIVSVLLV